MNSKYELAKKQTLIEKLEEVEAVLDALQPAKEACIDIYNDFDVSEMKGKTESIKQAWSAGQEICLSRRMQGNNDG